MKEYEYDFELLKDFCEYCSIDKKNIINFLKQKYSINTENKVENKEVLVYTDGACLSNGKSYATGGIGIYFNDTKESISENVNITLQTLLPELQIDKPTNQKAELLAILKALILSEERIKKDKNLIINIKTDSMYCINIFTKWYKAWEKNNWKTANGKNVLNKEIIQKILYYVKEKNIKFSYVPAHKTEPTDKYKYTDWYGNMKADLLAVKGAS